LFLDLARGAHSRQTSQPGVVLARPEADDLSVLLPSFVVSELTSAFSIGFLIFLPFLILDLVIANLLTALGMQMVSPTTISLPFKLLLFILADGWYLIARALVLGYR
jgi:type III secretion protein R